MQLILAQIELSLQTFEKVMSDPIAQQVLAPLDNPHASRLPKGRSDRQLQSRIKRAFRHLQSCCFWSC